MTAQHTPPTAAEYVDEASRWNVGAGILTMALAPFALPGIVLILVLALPFLAVGLVGALLAGLVLLPLRLGRALRARRRRAEEPRRASRAQGVAAAPSSGNALRLLSPAPTRAERS
jgi:hypothetical protein